MLWRPIPGTTVTAEGFILEDALPVTLEAASAFREQTTDNRARYRSEFATTPDGLADVLFRMDRNAEAEDIRAEARAVSESP